MSGASHPDQQTMVPGAAEPQPERPPDETPAGLQSMRMEKLLQPLAICALLACIAISISQFLQRLWPGFPIALGVGMATLTAAESIWAHRVLEGRALGSEDRTRFRFVEWVVLALVARFAPYLHLGGARLAADLDRWSLQPGGFFALEFLGALMLMGAFWGTALYLVRNLDELEASPWEEKVSTRSDEYDLRSSMPQHGQVDRQTVLGRITSVYYVGGAVLLLFAGMARLDYAAGFPQRPAATSAIVLNALVYFVLGLLLISQAQYTIQRARWQIQQVPVLDRIGRRWFVMVVIFLSLIALVSALLPIGYSVGILQVIATVIMWVIFGLAQVFFTILFLAGILASWVSSLFGISLNMPDMSMQAPPPPPMASDPTAGAGPAWWALVRSLLFWGILVAIVLYSLFGFARDRWGVLEGFSFGRWLNMFLDLWRGLRGGARDVLGMWGRSLSAGVARLRRRGMDATTWWHPHMGRLTPQERIRYYYISTLHRATRQGVERPDSATPLEYRERLIQALPESGSEIEELTQAFVEARYSVHDMPDEQAQGVARVWRALRRALNQRRRRVSERQRDPEE